MLITLDLVIIVGSVHMEASYLAQGSALQLRRSAFSLCELLVNLTPYA